VNQFKKRKKKMPNSIGGLYYSELEIGQAIEFTKEISVEDVAAFSHISGDNNPIHINEDYAKTTKFGGCIAHGILTAGLISAAIGTKLPGPGCIYVGQTLQFKRPVRVGATVTVRVEIKEKDDAKNFVTIETIASVEGKIVLTGEAKVMVPNQE
jgi:3-hydroxybutyryl-CoA dehydratase